MSMTEEEAAWEDQLAQLYEEFAPEAVAEFKAETTRSYFTEDPEVARVAVEILDDALRIQSASSRGSLILAVASIEIAMKTVFLRPLIVGLVHSSAAASLIADLAITQSGVDRFKAALTLVLAEHCNVDLNLAVVNGQTPLWAALKRLQDLRNKAIHQGRAVDEKELSLALGAAACLLDDILPRALSSLGLHLHDRYRVCGKARCAV